PDRSVTDHRRPHQRRDPLPAPRNAPQLRAGTTRRARRASYRPHPARPLGGADEGRWAAIQPHKPPWLPRMGQNPIATRRPLEALGDIAIFGGDPKRAASLYRKAYDLSIDAGDYLDAAWDAAS